VQEENVDGNELEEDEPKSLSETIRASIVGLLGLVATLSVSFIACYLFGGQTPLREAPGESTLRSASPVSFSVPDIGETGVLTRPDGEAIPAARSAAAYDAMVRVAQEPPSGALPRSETSGLIERVEPGTPAVFVRFDWGSYQVRLAGGAHKGDQVWVDERFWESVDAPPPGPPTTAAPTASVAAPSLASNRRDGLR
jgi:hypothetical protein